MSEVQPKVGEKWCLRGCESKLMPVADVRDFGVDSKYPLVCIDPDYPMNGVYWRTADGREYSGVEGSRDLVRKYVPPMPTGVWGVDNLDDKLLAELKEWHANGGEIECRSREGIRWNLSRFPPPDTDFYYRARGCKSEPQPQRKPITAEEAFELWGKVIISPSGFKHRVMDHSVCRLFVSSAAGSSESVHFSDLLSAGWTLDGHVICSGMSTKPQPGSVHVKLPPATNDR